jgi:1-acyl-sn-glycerol-3-phosphate acyltransferase
LRIYGIENLESLSGPVIFGAHHESQSDTMTVLAALPQRFRERKAPVVPVGIEGSRDVLPLARRWRRRAAVTVRFAAPVTYRHASPEAFAEDLQLQMARLLAVDSRR